MTSLYVFLILVYGVVPAILLSQTLKKVRQSRKDPEANLAAWQQHNLATFLVAFSFLPLLYFSDINLGLQPKTAWPFVYMIGMFVLTVMGIQRATQQDNLPFYIGGIKAAFMEEILFRGVIYGLLFALSHNVLTSLVISSLLFGLWHLKNIPWSGPKRAIPQALYTGFIAGPVFCLLAVVTGDIYLAILAHFVHNYVLTFTKKTK